MAARKPNKSKKQLRRNCVAVMLNDSEKRALDNYCKKYNIKNRSHLIRNVLMKTVLRRLADDSPTLFD